MKKKRKYGQYFTESVVADFMTSLITQSAASRILEPSCGKGVFLDSLAAQGFTNVRGYEIDDMLDQGHANVVHKSFLAVPTEEQYDVIIGNPPYIRWKNLEKELKEELTDNTIWNKYFNNLCDYLFIFILKSIEHLTDGGELIFICSDYWMNTTHSQSLRDYMCENGYFERIYHFKEAPLFEQVSASFIIFKYIKKSIQKSEQIRLLTYNRKGKPTKKELISETCFIEQYIPQFEKNKRWILATSQTQARLLSLETACLRTDDIFASTPYRIGDFCDIGNGMVSGMDKAFRLTKEEVRGLNKTEFDSLIPVLKAKNLEQYRYTASEYYIFINKVLSTEEFHSRYPSFAIHFTPYLDSLRARYNYGKDLPYWEFAFPRSRALFERNQAKIFVPCKERISHKDYFRFCYAPQGFYPLQDVTAIVPHEKCKESVEYITAYLNTPVVFDWLRFNGIVKGEIVEFSEKPLASTPYLPINWSNPVETNLHEKITQKTRNCLNTITEENKQEINHYFDLLFYEKTKNRLPA